MPRAKCWNRRRFLHSLLVAGPSAVSCRRAASRYRFLTDAEASTLAAICDQIIPADDFPSASQAGVVDFIDIQLTGPYRYLQRAYREGLLQIDREAQAQFGRRFAELSPAEQQAFLEEREKTEFFRMVRDHTLQGYYGDPRHGGNHDAISWRMLGIPNPPVRGRDHYELERS